MGTTVAVRAAVRADHGCMAVSLAVSNLADDVVCLLIEPVGSDFWMVPGARYRVVGGDVDPEFEVNVMSGCLAVWVNAGSVFDVRVVDEETGADVVCGDGRPAGHEVAGSEDLVGG